VHIEAWTSWQPNNTVRHLSDVRCKSLIRGIINVILLWTRRGRACHSQADQYREEGYFDRGEQLTLRL
jgi:hypothetical protein